MINHEAIIARQILDQQIIEEAEFDAEYGGIEDFLDPTTDLIVEFNSFLEHRYNEDYNVVKRSLKAEKIA